VRFGSDVYRFIFAAKSKTAQVDRSFRESVSTFRRMSLKESEQVRPLRIKIVTVGAHDTVEKLARHMATADHALDRFRVLNGLSAGDRLKPGEKVKSLSSDRHPHFLSPLRERGSEYRGPASVKSPRRCRSRYRTAAITKKPGIAAGLSVYSFVPRSAAFQAASSSTASSGPLHRRASDRA